MMSDVLSVADSGKNKVEMNPSNSHPQIHQLHNRKHKNPYRFRLINSTQCSLVPTFQTAHLISHTFL